MKKFFLLLLLISYGFSFFNYGNYCTCDSTEDCKKAMFSCGKVILEEDIDNLDIVDLNTVLDCNGHKIGSIKLKSFKGIRGTIENCIFNGGYNCLEVSGKINSLKIINNTFNYCMYGIRIDNEGNVSIENNRFFINNYGIYLNGRINIIKNNTFYKTKYNNIFCNNCERFAEIIKNNKNETVIEKQKTINIKKSENRNGPNIFLIVIGIIIVFVVGGVLLKRQIQKNEDEFQW